MNKLAYKVSLWLAAIFTLPTAWAIQLDISYGDSGYVQTNISSYNGYDQFTRNVLLQTDGKIVIAGVSNGNFALVRYHADGTTDLGFGVDGHVVTDVVGSSQDEPNGMVQQGDGKIVVAGLGFDTNNDFVLVRYNSNGTIDNTFGTDGQVITDTGGSDLALSIIRQADGKLVVSGSVDSKLSLIRYTVDGVLDTGFGVGGVATIATAGSQARAVIQQADGKLVAAGQNLIARFNTNGTLDNSFDTDGLNSMPATVAFAVNLALQDNGQLVVAGFSTGNDIAVARFNSDGSLDTDFGTDGVVTTDAGGNDFALGIVPDITDNKIVVTGQGASGTDIQIVVLRYNLDGTLDTTFSGDGIVETNFGSGRDFGQAIVQQVDNKYVVAGQVANGINSDFVTLRYNDDGSLDTSFNSTGFKVDWMGQKTKDAGTALVIQADGKLVAGGFAAYAENPDLNDPTDYALTRYDTDGNLDAGFATGGRLIQSIISPYSATRDLIMQADGAVVSLVETYNGSASAGALVRHDSNGGIDTSFGNNGIATLNSKPLGGIQQLDGKLVVQLANLELQRFDSSGDPDTGFGTAGVVTLAIGGGDRYSIVEQSGGKLVIVGRLGLARYTGSGVLDTTFGTDGQILFSDKVLTPMLVQQSDGKLLVAYFPPHPNISTTDPTLTIMRFSADGALDTSFGDAGTATTIVDDIYGANYIHALALQEGGKLVIFVRIDSDSFKLLRYNTNGSLDTSFDDDGIFDLPFTVANNGGIYQVGDMVHEAGRFHVLVADDNDFFIARFIDFEVAPVAGAVVAADVTQTNIGESAYSFTIDYSDANGDLEILSINKHSVSVCNGDSCASVTSTLWSGNSSSGTATYTMTPPGGSWDEGDNGTYTIAILPGAIHDSFSNYVEDDFNAGSFTVTVTDPTVPDPPTIVRVTPGDTSAMIEFTAPGNDGGAVIFSYLAYCAGGGGGTNISGAESPLWVRDLSNGVTYDCGVLAENSVGLSATSATVMVTPTNGGEVTLPPSGEGPGEVVTFTHTATPPGGGEPIPATLEVVASAASPPEPPAEADSLVSAIDISSTSTVEGYTLVVVFELPESSINEFTGFWKYGKKSDGDTPHWYDFGTVAAWNYLSFNNDYGYEISADKKMLTVYLQDGIRGDDDLTANARIVDPALPIVQVSPLIFKDSFD